VQYGLLRTRIPLFFRQVFWLTDQPQTAPSHPSSGCPNHRQWHHAVLVPAYSVGPTLRSCTVFPFHRPEDQGDTGRIPF